ncbi:MAG: PadR family transcriptional regulator [DPANN group archaeon]|nr:PadR family transcriptional regulator [DPANN group archaeon]
MALYVLYTVKKDPKYGYEILSDIKLKCKDLWVPSKGTLYPLLNKLENEGLISVK